MKPISRRAFCLTAGAGSLALSTRLLAASSVVQQHCVTERSYTSGKVYRDPFNEVELDFVITDPKGRDQRVPAFWAGEQTWRFRYAPDLLGRYTYGSICSDASNKDLHGCIGSLDVVPYEGTNPLYLHGPLRVASDQGHFEHADGAPFFWLGDTWWMGLCKRLRWPEDFQVLAADRLKKGFTVIQIVAGLYPDMPQFDPRGANEAGYPWEKEYARINPAYFDMADLRIQYLAGRGLIPCVVACWGYFLPILGPAKVKQHWRYLVARWGAYPVIWCLAGEGSMPYYLSKQKEQDAADQKRGWTEIAQYVRSIDPYHRLVTIHPSDSSRNNVEDPTVLDFEMLQTGHSDRNSIPKTINLVTGAIAQSPKMPVLDAEVCYEGIMEASRQEVQRFMFWTSILNGAAGHTYGANGIWQVNTRERPFGPSPHGRSWGDTPWEEAYQLPGSKQLGLAKTLLMRYPWWKLEPHPEWIEPHWSKENYLQGYCAGIPGDLRLAFIPAWNAHKLKQLEPSVAYHAIFFNPATGKEQEIGRVTPDSSGSWDIPMPPIFQDWVVVLAKSH